MGSSESVLDQSQPSTIKELFAFLQEHFHEYHEPNNLRSVLPVIYRCLQRNKNSENSTSLKTDPWPLFELLKQHKDNEDDFEVAIQITYQVLYSIIELDTKVFKLNGEMIPFLVDLTTTIQRKRLITKTVICIQFYLKNFDQDCLIRNEVWNIVKQRAPTSMILMNADVEILVQLIDLLRESEHNIFNDPYFLATTKHLLNSDDRFERKYGRWLLKKSVYWLTNQISVAWMPKLNQNLEIFWLMYMTILENLEEDQSHLILPSLHNLNELRNSEPIQCDWLAILYSRLLKHNNILVKRWAIEYFMSVFTSSDLGTDILKQVLEISNSNFLYNHENYFLHRDYFAHFLGKISQLFYTLFGGVNWKPVPMYMWLKCLHDQSKMNRAEPTYESLIQIASRVRALRNYNIRQKVIDLMNKCFANELEKMPLKKYINFIEALYNPTDIFSQYALLFNKPFNADLWEPETSFSERLLVILYSNVKELETALHSLLEFLQAIPKEQHGFLRFISFYIKDASKHTHVFLKLYDLNLERLDGSDLSRFIDDFTKNLVWDTHNERQKVQAHHAAVTYYLNHFPKEDCVKFEKTSTIVLNSSDLPPCTLSLFSKLINSAVYVNRWIIDQLIDQLQTVKCEGIIQKIFWEIMVYINKNNGKEIWEIYGEKLIAKYPKSHLLYMSSIQMSNLLKMFDKKLLLSGNFVNGEPRIEAVFQYYEFGNRPDEAILRFLWLVALNAHGDKSYMRFLLDCHKECTKKKPRYFEHSREHRSKFRIACGIYILYEKLKGDNDILDEIWNILLNENNQPDVTFIYEHILGYFEQRFEVLSAYLQKMPALTASQQITIAVITNHFCLRDELLQSEQLKEIIQNLLPFLMGPNFQTRLYCQLVLWNIMEKYDAIFSSDNQMHALMQNLMQAIALATNGKVDELLTDLRLIPLRKAANDDFHFLKVITYVTSVPFDELCIGREMNDLEDDELFKRCKENFLKKYIKKTKYDEETAYIEDEYKKCDVNNPIQRKMNPLNNIAVTQTDLIAYSNPNPATNMYVVASLIDKLPNLGGIARTCEVLGVQNFVINSKMHIEKPDFKNLRHEKDGIPAPLLGLLDYIVEIPQSGNVRSLNVHVTAALFMWEHCKQHILS
uniref:tRNA/rRNA methyltransferase SpoU type domain-containing protein n=1 Tax=Glossina austeni TaxID=7395 RepID=A0A1A9V5Z1_GLOAU